MHPQSTGRILHPNQEITAGYFHNIFHCRLKTMKVCPIIQSIVRFTSVSLFPRIFLVQSYSENGCHNIQFPVCFLRCFSFCYVHSWKRNRNAHHTQQNCYAPVIHFSSLYLLSSVSAFYSITLYFAYFALICTVSVSFCHLPVLCISSQIP